MSNLQIIGFIFSILGIISIRVIYSYITGPKSCSTGDWIAEVYLIKPWGEHGSVFFRRRYNSIKEAEYVVKRRAKYLDGILPMYYNVDGVNYKHEYGLGWRVFSFHENMTFDELKDITRISLVL